MEEKPSLFIGSSTEGLEFARAARTLLKDAAEVTLWNEGLFRLGDTVINQLASSASRFDFACLVLTPDDLVTSRQDETFGPRDNVIFELGLFMGNLGRERTFVVHQADAEVKIPSDLSGLITARYEWPRADENHQAAVGAACDGIRDQISALGFSEAKTDKEIRDIRSRQERQEAEVRSLQVALQGIVTQYELDKLVGLNKERPFLVSYSETMNDELQRLQAMGLIQNHEGVGVWTIRNDFRDRAEPFDLKQFFSITEQGREYLNLRAELLDGASGPE
jgi:Predicted nucleotide-binding protein containing TIR-like domain